MAEVDWETIKADYIAGMSQSQLAKKYHMSRSSVGSRCREGKWTRERDKVKRKADAKTVEKVSNRIAAIRAEKLCSVMEANDGMGRVLSRITSQLDALEEAPIKSMRDMADLAKAISMTADTMMRLYGIPTQNQAHTQQMAEERLKLDQARLEIDRHKAETEQDGGESVEIRIIAPGEAVEDEADE